MRPLALTMGEPGGIGPELALRAWLETRSTGPAFALYADPALIAARARRLGLEVPLREIDLDEATRVFPAALPVLPLNARAPDNPGVADPAGAAGVIEAIERAVAATHAGAAGAVVTNPIQKSALKAAGFLHPGHTEFLGTLAERLTGKRVMPVMMLASEELRVVPVTVHIPLVEVPRRLSTKLIVETGGIVARELSTRFRIPAPRLALCGLNPHAGEGGMLGSEDEAIIRPAVEALRREGIDARGPLPADTLFHARARKTYDVALGMYHDQVLVPLKTLAFDEGVNVTLGLPFIRTSPDHGTALDIAGSGRARPDSLLAALSLAARLAV